MTYFINKEILINNLAKIIRIKERTVLQPKLMQLLQKIKKPILVKLLITIVIKKTLCHHLYKPDKGKKLVLDFATSMLIIDASKKEILDQIFYI